MNWKYIITWCIMTPHIVHQNAPAHRIDEYGRDKDAGIIIAVMPSTQYEETSRRERIFLNRDSAIVFYQQTDRAQYDGTGYYLEEKIDCVKLDSVKIK